MATKKATTKKAATKKATTRKASAKKAEPKNTATKPRATGTGDKKMSAIDAAAKVLAQAKEPLNAKQMIEAMTAKGYWTSPGGKTPHATLYSAIIREIGTKGKDSRFKKTERGKFTLNGQDPVMITHIAYADEAESAQRANAWTQAAELWRRAAETCDDGDRLAYYLKQAAWCDDMSQITSGDP